MTYLTAHFSDQQSAMAAMDKLIGRGLGRARVMPLVERPSEPNNMPPLSAIARTRLEVEADSPASEEVIRSLIGSAGGTDVTRSDTTETPFSDAHERAGEERTDVERAVGASERGATGSGGPVHNRAIERTEGDDMKTAHDPHR